MARRHRPDRHDLLQQAAQGIGHAVYHVSGTPSMVVGTWRLLRETGVREDDIEVEAFRGYAEK